MLQLFAQFELSKISKYFRTKTLAKTITSLIFIGIFVFIGFGIFEFFVSGFKFINAEAVEDIRLALTLYIYEIFLLVLGIIIVFSALVTSMFSLFKGGINSWLIGTPGYTYFPIIIFIRSLVSSSLLTGALFLPMVLAFTYVNHLTLASAILIIASILLLLLQLNALTFTLITVVAYLYHKVSLVFKSVCNIKGLIVILLLIISVLAFSLSKIVMHVDLVTLFHAEDAADVISVANISNHFSYLPTHQFAMEILYLQNMNQALAVKSFLVLLFVAFLALVVWLKLSQLFYPVWLRFQEGGGLTNRHSALLAYDFSGSSNSVLFKKEMLIFCRNWKGLMWFIFLMAIWSMQIAANVIMGRTVGRYQTDISSKLILLQTIQYVIAIYFISSFSLRFVFPAYSVDRKVAWIIGSAPIAFAKIFFGRLIFYVTLFLGIGVLMSILNSLVLGVTLANLLYFTLLLCVVICFIVALALSFGAIFPNRETDDPEVISTSMPGLFFTAFALIYGTSSGLLLRQSLLSNDNTLLLLFITITIVLIFILLYSTERLVKKYSPL